MSGELNEVQKKIKDFCQLIIVDVLLTDSLFLLHSLQALYQRLPSFLTLWTK